MAFVTSAFIAEKQKLQLREYRLRMKQHPHVVAISIACVLLDKGDTFDDEETAMRWVFDRLGAVIKIRKKSHIHHSKHAWKPGLHGAVHTA